MADAKPTNLGLEDKISTTKEDIIKGYKPKPKPKVKCECCGCMVAHNYFNKHKTTNKHKKAKLEHERMLMHREDKV